MLDSSFYFVAGGAALLCLAASVCAPIIFSSLRLFLLHPFPRPRSCVVFWSRDVSSAVPHHVAPPIFRLRSESGAYTQAPLRPPAFHGGTPVLMPWPLVRRSDLWIQLAVHRRCHRQCRYDHSPLGLLTVSSLPQFGSTPAGRQPRL